MTFNRTEAAAALLAEIEEWCARTNTRETAIGHALFRHPGFVGLMRRRLQLSEEKEDIVRRFIANWPRGYHGELPLTHVNGTKPLRSEMIRLERGPIQAGRRTKLEIEQERRCRPRVDRDPCPRCGIRGDIGCNHSRAPIGTSFGGGGSSMV